jgi:signal transduction histidine kinase
VANLVDNALDASTSHVDIKFASRGEFLEIAVEDDGPGLGEDELEDCWKEGFSTKNSSGLGLSFVKRVIEEHGGSVRIGNRSAASATSPTKEGHEPVGVRCVMLIPKAKEGEV